ncbi:MAG: PEGA domain-containing protein [Myxococcota bacterium]|nr:PEGA domain-containing protein [Myxococcota bacterium]
MAQGETSNLDESKIDLRASAMGLKVSLVDDVSSPVGAGEHAPGSGADSASGAAPPVPSLAPANFVKRVNPYILMLVGFGLIAASVVIVFALFFNSPSQKQSRGVVTVTSIGENEDNLQVTSVPQNAELFVDGKSYGMIGTTGVSLRVEPRTLHTIRVVKDGFEVYELTFPGDARSRRKVEAFLVATVEDPETKDQRESKVADGRSSSGADEASQRKRAWKPPPPRKPPPISTTPAPTVEPPSVATPTETTVTKEPDKVPATASTRTTAPRSGSVGTASQASTRSTSSSEAKKPESSEPGAPSASSTRTAEEEAAANARAAAAARRSLREENQYFSGDGSWSGAEVFGRGCGRCHNGGKALKLIPSRKTKTEWRYFFDRRLHRRYAKLEKYFSEEELNRCLNHILQRTF